MLGDLLVDAVDVFFLVGFLAGSSSRCGSGRGGILLRFFCRHGRRECRRTGGEIYTFFALSKCHMMSQIP